MSRYPLWVYAAVALLIALAASGVGQFVPGSGMFLVLSASLVWVFFNVRRFRTHG